MRLTITDRLVAKTAQEGSAIPFTVKAWTDTSEPWVAVVPTTLRYRVDDPETGCEILGWTTATPASSSTITITSSQNTLSSCESREHRQLTVEVDHGLPTACVATRDYWVRGLVGVTA